MVTAYTYPSAIHVDAAGIDICLVGDSLGMVELGYDTTLPVTVDEMLYHCKAVARGASIPLLVGDLPFGSYEASPTVTIQHINSRCSVVCGLVQVGDLIATLLLFVFDDLCFAHFFSNAFCYMFYAILSIFCCMLFVGGNNSKHILQRSVI